ncbi:Vht1p [Saccharomyces eubayanus]|uniref:Vht1p n=1 Tax=Saccharomyces eubayanus TaxID=1080349 RepID=UPI0006C0E13E|nr:VHT1-like protein [Saccharomyces eubayanus]KOG99559.1 VHT1-like protein [Saccharomyces eubayanus]
MSDSKKSWKSYLPHLRVLPEENQDLYLEDTTSSIVAEEELHHDLGKSSKVDVTAESTAVEAHPQNLRHELPYEVRDEAGRKWWKYFDEFEYRVNKEYKKSRKWYEFLYPNHTTQTKAERRLLYKLDIVIALYFFMLCWSKSVDSNNYTNAYVSNMKEDLKMKGNDYVYTSTIANVGAIVFQLPFMYLLPRFPAHIILPVMDLGWTWFTFACYRAKTLAELRAYRFILSAFGAAYYPVSQYVLGCWYAPDEINSRVCLFFCGQQLGSVTSGLLQSRIFKSLNGVHGLAGWRWMFLIDAIAISLPTAIIGFFVIPGIPSKCYSLFLTDEEIRIARARNKRNQIKDGVDKSKLVPLWSRKLWKKVFCTPAFWVLVIFDMCSWNNMTAYSGSYTLWLKSNTKYSISQVNNLSVIPACLGFAYVIFCAMGADMFRCKWIFMVFAAIMNTVSCGLLIKWDISSKAKWYAFFTTYFSVAASPCLWSFINDFLRFDPQVKAVTWIAIYSFSQSTYAWIPTLAWPTVESPRFKTGYTVSLIFGAIYGLWTFVVLFFYKRNEKKHALGNGIILYDSSKGEELPEFVKKDMEEKDGYYYLKRS